MLRSALRKDLNQGAHGGQLDGAERRALAWLEKASRPVSAFENDSVVCDVLDALAANLDGTQAAPEYFSRRRRVLHRVLGYAVRKQRLEKNARQGQPARELDTAAGTRRRHGPAMCGQPSAHHGNAHRVQLRRPRPGTAVRRVLRLHVLRDDAPGRGRRPHPRRLPPARAWLGTAHLHRLQHRVRQGGHRRRAGPRAPRTQRPHQRQAAQRTAGTQARPPGPGAAGVGHPAARPPRAVRHRPGRAPIPQRSREPAPAVDLVAGLAEGPRVRPDPSAAGHAAAAPSLRSPPLRRHPVSTPAYLPQR